MIKITHSFDNFKFGKDTNENIGFSLTNKKGSYLYLQEKPESRYQGFFYFNNNKMCRIIEDINILNDNEITQIKNNLYSVERKRNNLIETFFMPSNFSSLVYEVNKAKEIELIMDVKESYDNRKFGRFYDINNEKDIAIIKFTKRTDNKEDLSDGFEEYSIYIAVKSDYNVYKRFNEWIKRDYNIDKERNSSPYQRFAYKAVRLKCRKLALSVSTNKEKAIKEAEYVFNNISRLKNYERDAMKKIVDGNKLIINKIRNNKNLLINKKAIIAGHINAINSLNNLIVDDKGIFAGLPWFFQFWSRDTAISSKALFLSGNSKLAKKFLFDILKTLKRDGRVQNIYNEFKQTNTADSTGWTFYKVYELCKENILNKKEIVFVKNKLLKSIASLEYYHTKDGFEINDGLETWMDTSAENIDDTRAGIRIEIQALRLFMYKFAYELTKNKKYKDKELQLRNRVKERFWNNNILADGIDDFTVRPNIFIAAYVYPELLTKNEWIKCFERSIHKLWLDWGGFSTIDKNHYLFCNNYTGESNKSYHRGDSWFWLNNLAAIVLYRTNKNKFKKYINKILEASTKEILWKGVVGCHAELSSASLLKSQGCLSQAWSNAMFVEMVNEIF